MLSMKRKSTFLFCLTWVKHSIVSTTSFPSQVAELWNIVKYTRMVAEVSYWTNASSSDWGRNIAFTSHNDFNLFINDLPCIPLKRELENYVDDSNARILKAHLHSHSMSGGSIWASLESWVPMLLFNNWRASSHRVSYDTSPQAIQKQH
jgi:hypothetical protein